MKSNEPAREPQSSNPPPTTPPASWLYIILSLVGAGFMLYASFAALRQDPATLATVIGIACMGGSFLVRPKAP